MSSSLDPRHATSAYLDQTLVGVREPLRHMAESLLDGRLSHVAVLGAPGSGKSHAAEWLLRALAARGWRTVRVLDPGWSLGSLQDLLAYVAARDAGADLVFDEREVPGVDTSVAALEERYRATGVALAVLVEDLPGLFERTLRGATDARRLARLLDGPGISLVVTTSLSRLTQGGRALAALFHEFEMPELSRGQMHELVARHAACAGDAPDGPAARACLALAPMIGGRARTVVALYQLARTLDREPEPDLLRALLHRMSPFLRRELDGLSPQQGLVVARLGLESGPMAAAQLGRHCGLPTSHTTAILDVLLQRRVVARVPGPGKRSRYAVADPLMRVFLAVRQRDHAGAYLDELCAAFRQVRIFADQRQAFHELGREFAPLLRAALAPGSDDFLAVLRDLLDALVDPDNDPGNRVLAAFLERPPRGQDLEQLHARVRQLEESGDDPLQVTAPERAVSHVALAAHFLHEEAPERAAVELGRALELAPNWSDLRAALAAVELAGNLAPSVEPESRPEGRAAGTPGSSAGARAVVHACALLASASPPEAARARDLAARSLSDHAPGRAALLSRVVAALPRREDRADRVLALLELIFSLGLGDTAFLGLAACHAFAVGRWAAALDYLEAYAEREPLDASVAPIHAWLAAMSGRPASFARALTRLEPHQRERLLPGLVPALRQSPEPERTLHDIAALTASWQLDAAALHRLYGALLWVRDQVESAWLARAIAGLDQSLGPAPEPYLHYRAFVESGANLASLCTLHPEMHELVVALHGAATRDAPRG